MASFQYIVDEPIANIFSVPILHSCHDGVLYFSIKIVLKLTEEPADTLTLVKAQNTLTKAQEAKPDAEADLAKSYEDGFNGVADAFLDLPTVLAGLDALLFGSGLKRLSSSMYLQKNQSGF